MAYTYAPYLPEVYGGKMFLVTPDTGNQFLVSVANDESEIPALVEYHLNPPVQPLREPLGAIHYTWGPTIFESVGGQDYVGT